MKILDYEGNSPTMIEWIIWLAVGILCAVGSGLVLFLESERSLLEMVARNPNGF